MVTTAQAFIIFTIIVALGLGLGHLMFKLNFMDRLKNKRFLNFMIIFGNLIAFFTLIIILSGFIGNLYGSSLSILHMSFLSIGIVIVSYLIIEKIGFELKKGGEGSD